MFTCKNFYKSTAAVGGWHGLPINITKCISPKLTANTVIFQEKFNKHHLKIGKRRPNCHSLLQLIRGMKVLLLQLRSVGGGAILLIEYFNRRPKQYRFLSFVALRLLPNSSSI